MQVLGKHPKYISISNNYILDRVQKINLEINNINLNLQKNI